ncbi:MAG TPA: hypothetical protein VFU81_15520, partial [Thermomicrobiales bacterium]|nr:hypothetical protein [Thermomicrobiales bacterium]
MIGLAQRRLSQRTLIYLLALLVAAFYGIPLLFMLSTSVKLPAEVFTTPPTLLPSRITFDNYTAVFSLDFVRFFWNSLVVAVGTTALALIFGIGASYAFSRLQFRGRRAMLAG